MNNIIGPINIIRISNNDKIIHMFMDYHIQYELQTSCDGILFDEYLYNVIKNNDDIKYDLYFETYKNKQKTNKQIYIVNFENKLSEYEKLNNLKIHYIDIRNNMKDIREQLKDIHNCFIDKNVISNNIIQYLIEKYNIIYNYIKIINNIIKIKCDKNEHDIINYTLNKIMNKYKNNKNKNKMQHIIKKIIKKDLVRINEYLSNHIKCLKKIDTFDMNKINEKNQILVFKNNEYVYETKEEIKNNLKIYANKIYIIIENLFSIIMDANTIRKIINCPNNKNNIIYTGSKHSIIYIYILCKYFKYNVTYVSNLNVKIEENKYMYLNELIKNMKYKKIFKLKKILYPSILIQCSNITKLSNNLL
jgi:hypothetical protein